MAANFAPHFAPSPAFVAQWIEQRFPKPQVVGPIPTEGAMPEALKSSAGGTFVGPLRTIR